MSKQPNGGPAFPKAGLDPWGEAKSVETGMTLRDYFAAKAMQGSLADPSVNPTDHKDDFARWCYEVADAMIAARDEK
ncbi:hypothetical protein [Stutzerimonas stutzeri]|uniref:hypothetical protein n=1 Tax=Stutzerimonas stutzeri TaxID=316 RepID=UPI003B796380